MKWVVAVMVLISMYGSGALACSCVPEREGRAGVAEALEQADLVFVGRIESKEKFTVEDHGEKLQFERVQFYIVQSWKGEKAARVYVETSVTCCLCGYRFPPTGTFLVYAFGPDKNGYYSTSICVRTKPLKNAAEEITMLDAIVAETRPGDR